MTVRMCVLLRPLMCNCLISKYGKSADHNFPYGNLTLLNSFFATLVLPFVNLTDIKRILYLNQVKVNKV